MHRNKIVKNLGEGNYKERERERQGDIERERERNIHVLKRGWTKESITEMLICLVSEN